MRHTILFIFGTRPEAIKLCPVVKHMRERNDADVRVCVTAQHREMLDQVLTVFGVTPDYDLNIMRPGQTLTRSTAGILEGLEPVLGGAKPSMAVVQGDTTTTFCGALAGFYAGVPVSHVEAGLRTGDPRQPFPEEINRQLVAKLSTLHFAATRWAAENLLAEGIASESVHITGNTGIDAVLQVADRLQRGDIGSGRNWGMIGGGRKLIVVTAHRRESFGEGFQQICAALLRLASRPDVQIVYPVHRNPNVSAPVRESLGAHPNVLLTDPLDYVSFVDLMRHAWLLLTDSGGIQEEAPSLGKPVLVMRDKTERPEAVQAGTAQLVGTGTDRILRAVEELLHYPAEYRRRALICNPYGDGAASARIAAAIMAWIERSGSD